MKVLIIDNYDSFTFNLYQYIGEALLAQNERFTLEVQRNDETSLKKIVEKKYHKIIISPGPGDPRDKEYFGVCSEVITKIGTNTPVLGICLGMQGIAHYFGGEIKSALKPMHGKKSIIKHDEKNIFQNIPQDLEVMRYHSLTVDRNIFPDCLEITAESQDTKEIMGLRHKIYPIEGVQFHPESFATERGKVLLKNFLYGNIK